MVRFPCIKIQRDYRDRATDRIRRISFRAIRHDRDAVRLLAHRYFCETFVAVIAYVEEADAVVVGIGHCQERVIRREGQWLGRRWPGKSRGCITLGGQGLLFEPQENNCGKAAEEN